MLIVEAGASIADAQTLEAFEERLGALASPATTILCINDPARIAPSSAVASSHDVDLAPELAPVGREGTSRRRTCALGRCAWRAS